MTFLHFFHTFLHRPGVKEGWEGNEAETLIFIDIIHIYMNIIPFLPFLHFFHRARSMFAQKNESGRCERRKEVKEG